MEFVSDFGQLQRLMASSIAGVSRRQTVIESLNIKSGNHIIDVGCGGGHLLEQLAGCVGIKGCIFGLDPSEEQLKQARERCSRFKNIVFLKNSADAIDLEENSCDAVTSTQAYEYIDNVDDALEEATRILKPSMVFQNISILWDHFRFFGAEKLLNDRMHDAWRAHCAHQMLPMELPGKLENLGYRHITNRSLAFLITKRDANSPAKYTEQLMASFAIGQGVSEVDAHDWQIQLQEAEEQGRFGFTSFPVLTQAYASD